MHIVLGALGSMITVLWLLHRLAEMGIDLGGLNPWLWQRRRKWRKKHDANPIFSLDSPLDLAGLLVTSVAKLDGDMTAAEKAGILALFETEFHLSKRDAAGLLIASVYLFGKGDEVREKLPAIMAPSQARFSPEQANSTLEMMRAVSELDGGASEIQSDLINQVADVFGRTHQPKGKWD
jgi:uncharacterized tellurite resistance protein B-like protein